VHQCNDLKNICHLNWGSWTCCKRKMWYNENATVENAAQGRRDGKCKKQKMRHKTARLENMGI